MLLMHAYARMQAYMHAHAYILIDVRSVLQQRAEHCGCRVRRGAADKDTGTGLTRARDDACASSDHCNIFAM